jgi:hypothetical protein
MEKNRILSVLLAGLLAILQVYAAQVMCVVFSNIQGYDRCQPFCLFEISIYTLISILPSFFLPVENKVSSVIIWIVYLTHVMSGILALPIMVKSGIDELLFASFISLSYIFFGIFVNKISFRFIKIKVHKGLLVSGFVLCSVATVSLIDHYFPITLEVASIFDVYVQRSFYKQTLNSVGNPLLGYLVILAGYSFAPISSLLGLIYFERAKYIKSIFFLFLAVFLAWASFAATAFKSVAFIFIAVLIFAMILKNRKNYFTTFILCMLSVVILIAIISIISKTSPVFIHWFRRAFVAPGRNLALYFEHIGYWNFDGLAKAPSVICQIYYGTDGSANAGLYGDGLAFAGVLGVLRNLFIFISYLLILDSVSSRIPLYLSASLILPQAYALSNSGTTTVFFTYGLVFSILFLWFLQLTFFSRKYPL